VIVGDEYAHGHMLVVGCNTPQRAEPA
jgi:hypothetical protein